MAEWTNPIFYLNAAGLGLSIWVLIHNRKSAAPLGMALVFVAGTGLHFVGDLLGADENLDHIFIHGILALALLVGMLQLRSRRAG